jgi:uncharacterized membrane protein YbaN (DUF454 family)
VASKALFNLLGIGFVGLGILGAVLPLLPATPFLLLASACFVRGSSRLHRWLMQNRVLGPYIRDFKERRGMPVRAKVVTLAILWASLLVSAYRLDRGSVRLALGIVGVGVTGIILKIKTPDESSVS